MTKSESFTINIRGDTDTNISKYFFININIPELRKYRKLQMYVKEFIIINTAAPITNQVNAGVYTLNSDTLVIENNYDNFVAVTPSATANMNVLRQGSKVLAVVSNTNPYFSNPQESYFDVLNINGNHRFWIDNFRSQSEAAPPTLQAVDFFVSFVIKASND